MKMMIRDRETTTRGIRILKTAERSERTASNPGPQTSCNPPVRSA